MKPQQIFRILSVFPVLLFLSSCTTAKDEQQPPPQAKQPAVPAEAELAQVPTWSREDLDFFLHGSMSTEVVPETVLRAFIRIYPDLFPSQDFSHLGLIPDPQFGWPVGFSRKTVPHLGGLSAVGVNCAACHVGEVTAAPGAVPVRVLGMTSRFDAEAFFGSIIVSTFRTADPDNMKKFLTVYLNESDPLSGAQALETFENEWLRQQKKIKVELASDPAGTNNLSSGMLLHQISKSELRLDQRRLADGVDLAVVSHSMLKLFHNMRAALHVPDAPPEKLPPPSGPGRNDAFGLLSAVLFGVPQPPAPVKYGLVWDVEHRPWVHWDGNTRSPLGRNLLASLGLGSPLIGNHGELDFAVVKRQTDLSEQILPPHYPFAIDLAAAKRGTGHYQAQCASCHDGPENYERLHSASEVGTDPQRADGFTPQQAELFNKFFTDLETPGYKPFAEPGIRSTQKYFSPSLPGVWARSPYLHNGSVRTMQELLASPAERAKTFHRGSGVYDAAQMGYIDEGSFLFDTSVAGNSNSGHAYGTGLSAEEKRDLIEYLKTL